MNLQTVPRFYDCEMRRVHVLDGAGRLSPMRRFSRAGECVRWITGMEPAELGGEPRWAFLAVPAEDGEATIAAGQAGDGSDFGVAMNSFFTCMHTDCTVVVPAKGRRTTRQVLYLVQGDAAAALRRFRGDFDL